MSQLIRNGNLIALTTKSAWARVCPAEFTETKDIHDKINSRFLSITYRTIEAMNCDWACTSRNWLKRYQNLPKIDKNGPFNTNLIVKSIRS